MDVKLIMNSIMFSLKLSFIACTMFFLNYNTNNLQNFAYAGEVTVAPSDLRVYQITEQNEIANVLCRVFVMLTGDVAKAVAAFSLIVLGASTYFGKFDVVKFFTIVMGLAAFFAAGAILKLFAPYSGIGSGCRCQENIVVGPSSTAPNSNDTVDLKLKSDCSPE